MPSSILDPDLWAAARLSFEAGATAQELAGELDVHPSTVYRRIRKESWGVDDDAADASGGTGAPAEVSGRPQDARRIGRIEAALDRAIARVEERLDAKPAASETTGDEERRARTLAALMRVVEKAMEMRHQQAAGQTSSKPAEGGRSVDELRLELKRRLDRLLAEARRERLDRKPDGGGD